MCGYHKKYGCEHVLLKVIDLWKNELDSNNFAGTIPIDLSKAFDCVPLPYGFLITTVDACRFMSIYLNGRLQRVRLSNDRKLMGAIIKRDPPGI